MNNKISIPDMRVLHLFSDIEAGGAEKMVLSTCRELHERGIYSSIACPEGSYLHKMALEMGLNHQLVKFNGSLDIPALFRLLKILRDEKITIMHAHLSR